MCTISLPVLNILAASGHALNAIIILICILIDGVIVEDRNTYETEYQFTTWNNGTLAQENKTAYTLHITALMLTFSALSCVFQMFSGFCRPRYIGYYSCKKTSRTARFATDEPYKTHSLRFIEYAISAPIMFVAISLLSGIRNAHLLAALGVLVAMTMGCGLVAEQALGSYENGNQPMYNVAVVSHLFGWLGVSTAYGILFATTDIVIQSGVSEGPPDFVWAIIFTQFFAFMSFGVVQFLQILIRKTDTQNAETAYIILSLTSKTILTWLIFFSVLIDT